MNKSITGLVVLSEVTHIFCCALPALFSILSLLSNIGMAGIIPGFIHEFHHLMHDYEVPMIATSAIILAFGWALYGYSRRIDCLQTGCHHEPCKPKKNRTHKILIVATALFAINLTVYLVFHH